MSPIDAKDRRMISPQFLLPIAGELIVDLFAE